MKYGVNTWVWTAPLTVPELKKLAPKIAGMGFDHIEIPVDDPATLDFKACGDIIHKAGIESISICAAMGSERDLIDPDPQVRRTGMDYLKACMDGLQVMGGTNLVGPFYSSVGRTWQQSAEEREQDMQILIPILRELADYAVQKGALLGMESLNRFETSFITTTEQVLELLKRVDRPALKVNLDLFHLNIEEDSLGDAIRSVGDLLIEVHANENNRGTPGKGHMPWQEVAAALKDIHFDGIMVIESFTTKVKSIAKAAAIWRPLAKSQDALAADGVKFLRELMA